jgi:hypothetical protein
MGTSLALTPDGVLLKKLKIRFGCSKLFPFSEPPKLSCKFEGGIYVGPKGVVRGVNKGEGLAPEGPNSRHIQNHSVLGWP